MCWTWRVCQCMYVYVPGNNVFLPNKFIHMQHIKYNTIALDLRHSIEWEILSFHIVALLFIVLGIRVLCMARIVIWFGFPSECYSKMNKVQFATGKFCQFVYISPVVRHPFMLWLVTGTSDVCCKRHVNLLRSSVLRS